MLRGVKAGVRAQNSTVMSLCEWVGGWVSGWVGIVSVCVRVRRHLLRSSQPVPFAVCGQAVDKVRRPQLPSPRSPVWHAGEALVHCVAVAEG